MQVEGVPVEVPASGGSPAEGEVPETVEMSGVQLAAVVPELQVALPEAVAPGGSEASESVPAEEAEVPVPLKDGRHSPRKGMVDTD